VIKINSTYEMLDECAPGYTRSPKLHHVWVTYNSKTYRKLPKGPHGKPANYPVEQGLVRSMARMFQIEECARNHLGIRLIS
jgi:hypothetical protein